MKLVTLHEPWATLAALGLKQIETRGWSADYRGELAIHAAKRKPRKEEILAIQYALGSTIIHTQAERDRIAQIDAVLDSIMDAELGCIKGVVTLTNCQKMVEAYRWCRESRPDEISIYDVNGIERALGLWQSGRFALTLENSKLLSQFVPFTSRQGKLLPVPSYTITAVRNNL